MFMFLVPQVLHPLHSPARLQEQLSNLSLLLSTRLSLQVPSLFADLTPQNKIFFLYGCISENLHCHLT